MNKVSLDYRADIDGLRAISALAIVFFHLGFTGFTGGFVGVDIFFVISGYLIVPKLANNLQAGTFTLGKFYENRIRRILPALLLVLLFTTLVGFFILSPREYSEYAASTLAVLAFGANLFFNDRSDYFADAAHQKPFLHAWSLGIEEQFYIIIPCLLLLLWSVRRQSPGKVIVWVTLLSFIYNLVFIRINETHTFYMPMSRFWELGLGGLLGLYSGQFKVHSRFALPLAALGMVLLLVAIFSVDDSLAYPGITALLPVLGACLLIYAGQLRDNGLSKLLGCWPLRYIGRLSYSLYLIHWPLIVFVRLYLSRPLELFEQLAILAFSFVWAAMSWHFMESKILNKQAMSYKSVKWGTGFAASLCGVAAIIIVNNGGLEERMSERSQVLLSDIRQEKLIMKSECAQTHPLGGKAFSRYPICEDGNTDARKILFWGDSHAEMISDGFRALVAPDLFQLAIAEMPSCSPLVSVLTSRRKNRELCGDFVNLVLEYVQKSEVDVVVLAGRWANLASSVRSPGDGGRSHQIFDREAGDAPVSLQFALKRTIAAIEAAGASVLVVGPVPEVPFHVPDTLVRTRSGIGQLPEVSRMQFDLRQAQVLAALKNIHLSPSVQVLYPHDYLCDEVACAVENGALALYTDDDHLSVEGTRPIIENLVSSLQVLQ